MLTRKVPFGHQRFVSGPICIKDREKEVAMHMRPGDPSPHVCGVRSASRIAGLACSFAMLALAAASVQAQTKLDVRRLFTNHLRTAGPVATVKIVNLGGLKGTRNTDPVPIPGGLAPGAHIFAPGPADIGGQGLDVELNGITNFRGFSALGYLAGTATDSNGNRYDVGSDMRVFQGEYVSADGSHHRGTFVFI